MTSNTRRKSAGVLASLMIFLSACGARLKTDNIKFETMVEDQTHDDVISIIDGEEDHEKNTNSNLSQRRDNLENAIMIYNFLDKQGLRYMQGKPSLLNEDERKNLDKMDFEEIENKYYEWTESDNPYIERELEYVYNKSYKKIKKELQTGLDALERETKITIADAINKIYENDLEGAYINSDNLDEKVLIEPSPEDTLGSFTIYVLDGTTDDKIPYYVEAGDNTIYKAIKTIYEIKTKLDNNEALDIKEIFKTLDKVYEELKYLGETVVIIDMHNNIYTLSTKEIKKQIQEKYGKGY